MTTTQVRHTAHWMRILEETGVFRHIEQNLALWRYNPLFACPRISVMRFHSGADFMSEALKVNDVSWDELITELERLNVVVADEIRVHLGVTPPVRKVPEDSLSFYKFGTFAVVPDRFIADSEVLDVLEKSLDHRIMKALRANTYPHAPGNHVVAALLKDYPELSHLVGLALIQLGYCSAYGHTPIPVRPVIEYYGSVNYIIDNSIHHIVAGNPLPRLANFTCNPKNDDAVFRDLVAGCQIAELENIMIEFGYSRSELNALSSHPPAKRNKALVDVVTSFSRSITYKVRILQLLRKCKPTPNMLPWLDQGELRAWLNQEDVTVPANTQQPSERSLVEAVFAKAKVINPAFIDLFISEGYRLDHLEDVLTYFDNSDTQPLRALLTGPNKLDVLKALRSPQ